MTNEEYLEAQTQIIHLGQMLTMVDVETFLQRAERADAVGSILDPTLWRKGHKRLEVIRNLARAAAVYKAAALEFQRAMLKIAEEEGTAR